MCTWGTTIFQTSLAWPDPVPHGMESGHARYISLPHQKLGHRPVPYCIWENGLPNCYHNVIGTFWHLQNSNTIDLKLMSESHQFLQFLDRLNESPFTQRLALVPPTGGHHPRLEELYQCMLLAALQPLCVGVYNVRGRKWDTTHNRDHRKNGSRPEDEAWVD